MTTTIARPTDTADSESTRKAKLARAASRRMSQVTTTQKNDALRRIADAIEAETPRILAVNGPEIERGRANGLTGSFIDRMELNEARLKAIANDTRAVAALPDPIGVTEEMVTRPNGLQIGRIRVPLGVIATIYESRPNVTVDIAAVCIK